MLRLARQYLGRPVLSLHAGHAIARVSDLIVNPHSLSLAGFYCLPTGETKIKILLPQNVREAARDGLVINHEEDLTDADELVRLEEVLKMKFRLEGKPVVTESKKRLGRVSDFVVDDLSWKIMKLHVQPPAWRAFFSNTLIIERAAVISVSQRSIVVKDATVKAEKVETAPATVPTAAA